MALPKQRHTHFRRDRARKELELKPKDTKKCEKCGKPKLPHRICPNCGTYKGREYVNTAPKLKKGEKTAVAKKAAPKKKAKKAEKEDKK
jgi:large subunit ribosomal protein L32